MNEAAYDEALAWCEGIALDRSDVTGRGPYAEGYRRAALDIVRAVRLRGTHDGPSPLHDELGRAEIEARTLARVLARAAMLATELDPDTSAAETLRALLLQFFRAEELPGTFRRPRSVRAVRARCR